MDTLATTRMSSKGQVVIPETIRKKLNLKEGTQFVVIGKGDVVILKTIAPPDMDEFEAILETAREQARQAGLTQADIAKAVAKARSRK